MTYRSSTRVRNVLAASALATCVASAAAQAQAGASAAPAPPAATAAAAVPPPSPARGIVAVVNGDVITRGDVENRRRLFALSTGLPVTKEVLDRLTPQVLKQLVDERLRLQEVQRRKIVVADKDIADALAEIESRNGMPQGGLRQKLAGEGVDMRTLIDQIRVQIGWARVLHEQLGENAEIKAADVHEQQELFKAEIGQAELRLGEIFIPVDDPAHEEDARRFADAVIGQLRAGAPFAVVAAQFSQSQSALQGGDMGWVQPNQLDPEIARIAAEMPPGAISNAIRVPGGFSIVTLHSKREIGHDVSTQLSIRAAFLPFTAALNPSAPTDQQKQALEKAKSISTSVHSCPAMEAANTAIGSTHPSDPGMLRLEQLSPPTFRQLLGTLPMDRASGPLVSSDGVMVVIVCSREERNFGMPTDKDIADRLLSERIELASRQLMRDLQRRGAVDLRS